MIQLLFENGAYVDVHGCDRTPSSPVRLKIPCRSPLLCHAAAEGHVEIVMLLLNEEYGELDDVDDRDDKVRTYLS